jgi:hypothetical protein
VARVALEDDAIGGMDDRPERSGPDRFGVRSLDCDGRPAVGQHGRQDGDRVVEAKKNLVL